MIYMSNLQIPFVYYHHHSYPFHPYYYSSLEVHHTIDHQEGDKIDLPYYLTEEVAEDMPEKEEID